jgi:hypothetical protein
MGFTDYIDSGSLWAIFAIGCGRIIDRMRMIMLDSISFDALVSHLIKPLSGGAAWVFEDHALAAPVSNCIIEIKTFVVVSFEVINVEVSCHKKTHIVSRLSEKFSV